LLLQSFHASYRNPWPTEPEAESYSRATLATLGRVQKKMKKNKKNKKKKKNNKVSFAEVSVTCK
jgi:hypothetical protein